MPDGGEDYFARLLVFAIVASAIVLAGALLLRALM
jgi:hypothetical protein